MFIYVGKTFTSAATGARVVTVTCDRCGTRFFYKLVRQGIGAGTAPYYIGQASAARRAEKRAQKQLAKKLQRESELVCCPGCHWINESLVKSYRRTRHRWMAAVGAILAFFVFLIIFSIRVEKHTATVGDWSFTVIVSLSAAAIVAAVPITLQWWVRNRINPNRHYPKSPILPEGTPKGWTEAEAAVAQPQEASGRFVPTDPRSTAYPDWAVFRAGHLVMPPVCCECLAPATTTFQSPFKVNEYSEELQAPLCRECASRLRNNWWTAAMATTAVVCLIGGIVYCVIRADMIGKIMASTMIVIFGTLIGAAIVPGLMARPYKLRRVDGARSIFRIRFRSEQYTEMVRAETHRLEDAWVAGLAAKQDPTD